MHRTVPLLHPNGPVSPERYAGCGGGGDGLPQGVRSTVRYREVATRIAYQGAFGGGDVRRLRLRTASPTTVAVATDTTRTPTAMYAGEETGLPGGDVIVTWPSFSPCASNA